MSSKVILFLGGHEENKDLIAVIKKIRKKTRKIPNNKKILVIECTYIDLKKFTLDQTKNEFKIIFEELINTFQLWRNKILKEEKLQNHEFNFATALMQFGKNEGYYYFVLEEPHIDLSWAWLQSEKENIVQLQRDEKLVKQILNLIKNHPDKIIIVVRGKKHERWLPSILEKNSITPEVIFFS